VCRLGGYKLSDLTHAAMISYGRKLNDACVGLDDSTHADNIRVKDAGALSE